jgi:hypothetical protein
MDPTQPQHQPHQYGPPVPVVPGQPAYPPPAYVQATPAPKSRKTLWIVLSVVGALLGLCCIGGIATLAAGGKDNKSDLTDRVNELTNPTTPANQPSTPSSTQQPADPEPTLPPGTITDQGTLEVGRDIPAGTYRGIGCGYWARNKSADGSFDSIIANDNVASDEVTTIAIRKGEYLDTDCDALVPVKYVKPVGNVKASSRFGTIIVGVDIPAGTWRGTAQGDCYWARLRNFGGGFDAILANDNVAPGSKFTITVRPTDKGLHLSSDCGPVTRA